MDNQYLNINLPELMWTNIGETMEHLLKSGGQMELSKVYDRMNITMNKYNTEDILSGIVEYQFMDLQDSLRLNKAELIAGRLIKFNVSNSKYSYLFKVSERMLELANNAIVSIGFNDMIDTGIQVKDKNDEEKKKAE